MAIGGASNEPPIFLVQNYKGSYEEVKTKEPGQNPRLFSNTFVVTASSQEKDNGKGSNFLNSKRRNTIKNHPIGLSTRENQQYSAALNQQASLINTGNPHSWYEETEKEKVRQQWAIFLSKELEKVKNLPVLDKERMDTADIQIECSKQAIVDLKLSIMSKFPYLGLGDRVESDGDCMYSAITKQIKALGIEAPKSAEILKINLIKTLEDVIKYYNITRID